MCRNICLLVMAWLAAATASGQTNSQNPATAFLKQAQLTVAPEVLADYVGTYRFPSGALFRVFLEDGRLMAGTPPHELLPQTENEFASNRLPAQVIFDREGDGEARRLNFRIGKHDLWMDRVDPRTTADPTRMVDAGGHALRMLVTGEGSPTVVFEDGFGSSIETRSEFQAELSKMTSVVTYAHAGTGGSEPGPPPRDARQAARELRTMLKNADIQPPFVLVGGSIGADYLRVFAHQYPEDVCGLVMLDPAPDWEALHAWTKEHSPEHAEMFLKMNTFVDAAVTEMMKHHEPGRAAEWAAVERTRQQAREAFPLPKVPIVQITGAMERKSRPQAQAKADFFSAWLAEHIPHAKHVIAEKSRHAVFLTEPELVLREMRELLTKIRQSDLLGEKKTP